MRINEVEKTTGIPKKSIRFYESEGLLSPGRELGNDYRNYGEKEVEMLRRIKLLRQLAVPIDSIRKLQGGSLTLTDCMKAHTRDLRRSMTDLQHISAICQGLAEENITLDGLDTDELGRRMREMEEGGVRFMDPNRDAKRRKMVGPVIAAAIFVVLFGVFLGMILWGNTLEPVPWPLLIVLVLIFVALIVGILLALSQRIREIKKGEEDEALHY